MDLFRRKNKYFGLAWSNLTDGFRPFALIIVIGLLLYVQTLFFGFSYLDDNALILENEEYLSDIGNIGQAFSTDVFMSSDKFYYRPIMNVSLLLDAQVGGTNPFIFHLLNVIIHIVVSCLIFMILRRLSARKEMSLILSLFFLIHPALVQAVAWIPGRNDSLLALFVLSSFWFLFKLLDDNKPIFYVLHVALFVLALLSKETAILFPLIVFAYIYFVRRKKISRENILILAASYIIPIIIFLIARSRVLMGGTDEKTFDAIIGAWQNLPAILLYIGKILFPFNLSVMPTLADSSLFFGILAIVVLLVAYFLNKKHDVRLIIFGLFWFLIFLIPSFARFSEFPDFLEHRAYLSMFGFLLLFAGFDYVKKLNFEGFNRRVIIFVLLFFAAINFFHCRNFSQPLIFWQSAVKSSPNSPLAHRNLGVMYYMSGNTTGAEAEYIKSLKINPNEPMANNNLGVIHMEAGNYWQAEIEFERELTVNPEYDKAMANLSELYYREGRMKGLNNTDNRLK